MEASNNIKKRQIRSVDEWRDLLNAWQASGLSSTAWCRLKGISESVLARWRRKLDTHDKDVTVGVNASAFIPVQVNGLSSTSVSVISLAPHIDIMLKSGHRLQVQGLGEQQMMKLVQHLVM
jgi:hypothetical protein